MQKIFGITIVLVLISLSQFFSQDTLIWKNGNRMVVNILSVDSFIRFNNPDDLLLETSSLKLTEQVSIHYQNGRIVTSDTPIIELIKWQKTDKLLIHKAGPIFRDGGGLITENELLNRAENKPISRELSLEIWMTKRAKHAEVGIAIAGGVSFITGVCLGYFGAEGEYISTAQIAGILCILASVPIEILSLVPHIIRKVHSRRVMKLYNRALIHEVS
jgi:hypothetical protein